ncbi:hypothetical protein ANTPLA_LOCUS9843 [Anthophora plagiata]
MLLSEVRLEGRKMPQPPLCSIDGIVLLLVLSAAGHEEQAHVGRRESSAIRYIGKKETVEVVVGIERINGASKRAMLFSFLFFFGRICSSRGLKKKLATEILINAHRTLESQVFFIQSSWANLASILEKYLLHPAPVTTGETDVLRLSGLRLEQKL